MKNEHCNGSDFDFLIGKSIIKVEETKVKDEYGCNVDGYILTCSDDTQIIVATNDGCGGCRNGWSSFEDLKKLETNHNVITNVKCEYKKIDYASEGFKLYEDDEFNLFIYYQDDMLTIKGSDGYGNGWYGGGFYVTIKDLKKEGMKDE